MAIPNKIEVEDLYRLEVAKVTNIANAILKPGQVYTVKGKVVQALATLDEAAIVAVEKVGP